MCCKQVPTGNQKLWYLATDVKFATINKLLCVCQMKNGAGPGKHAENVHPIIKQSMTLFVKALGKTSPLFFCSELFVID